MAGDTLRVLPRFLLLYLPSPCLLESQSSTELLPVFSTETRPWRALPGHQHLTKAHPATLTPVPSTIAIPLLVTGTTGTMGWGQGSHHRDYSTGTHGKVAMVASLVKMAVLGSAGPLQENKVGAGSRCLRQNSAGDRPGSETPSGRSALEETKRQGVCLSM